MVRIAKNQALVEQLNETNFAFTYGIYAFCEKLTCGHVAKKITNLSKFRVIELSAIEGLSQ